MEKKIAIKKRMLTLMFVVRSLQHTKVLTVATIFCSFLVLHSFSHALAQHACLQSIIATTPDTQFTIDKDGTVSDVTTGLMWMRCSLGQEWNGKTCSGKAVILPWANALKAAADFNFAGYTDWRLPNKNELESIVEDRCFAPAINSNIFPGTPSAYFWSSSPYAPVAEGSWSVDFGYGAVNASVKSGSIHTRLVRDGEQ
jgi:hypothetical protein